VESALTHWQKDRVHSTTWSSNPLEEKEKKEKKKKNNIVSATNAERKKPRYLSKPRRLSHTIQKMSSNNARPETSVASSIDAYHTPEFMLDSSSTNSTSNETTKAVVTTKGKTKASRQKQKQKQKISSSTSSSTGSPPTGPPAALSQVIANHVHPNPDDDDSSSIVHICCTVASDDAANVQTRHSRSRGTLVCVECGMRFINIKSLQKHIENKTVWTNRSLLGNRVSVMWAHNQWYEGTVTQYDTVHRRHCVVYDDGEQKWYHMSNKTFYVVSMEKDEAEEANEEEEAEEEEMDGLTDEEESGVQQQHGRSSGGTRKNNTSSKESKTKDDAAIEFNQFEEPVSQEYLLAQSIVHACFGNATQQVGYRTDGHLCVTEQDRIIAHDTGSSLLYGEVLPRGCNRILDVEHLNAAGCRSLYDLGMGIGKFALQAFVQFPNLDKVVGIELAYSRFVLGERAALTLVKEWPSQYTLLSRVPNHHIIITSNHPTTGVQRTLEFRRGNLFAATDCQDADIVIAQTNFPSETQIKLCRFLGCMKPKCKILTYLNLIPLWKKASLMFRQLAVNRSTNDRFATSWSMHRGCHFFLWERIDHTNYFDGQKTQEGDEHQNLGVSGCCFRLFSAENSRVHNSREAAADREHRQQRSIAPPN